MSRLCLDTSAYSHMRRGNEQVGELLRTAARVLMPVIVLGELRAGFRKGNRTSENEADLRRFLAEPAVEVLEVDEEAASVYADIVSKLRAAGSPLPTNDVWIAALAAREGATVLTFDEHFKRIERIGVHHLS